MLAVGDTVQGEGGWYQGDQSFYKWDVTKDQQWVKVHGPLDVVEYKNILTKEAEEGAKEDENEKEKKKQTENSSKKKIRRKK